MRSDCVVEHMDGRRMVVNVYRQKKYFDPFLKYKKLK